MIVEYVSQKGWKLWVDATAGPGWVTTFWPMKKPEMNRALPARIETMIVATARMGPRADEPDDARTAVGGTVRAGMGDSEAAPAAASGAVGSNVDEGTGAAGVASGPRSGSDAAESDGSIGTRGSPR